MARRHPKAEPGPVGGEPLAATGQPERAIYPLMWPVTGGRPRPRGGSDRGHPHPHALPQASEEARNAGQALRLGARPALGKPLLGLQQPMHHQQLAQHVTEGPAGGSPVRVAQRSATRRVGLLWLFGSSAWGLQPGTLDQLVQRPWSASPGSLLMTSTSIGRNDPTLLTKCSPDRPTPAEGQGRRWNSPNGLWRAFGVVSIIVLSSNPWTAMADLSVPRVSPSASSSQPVQSGPAQYPGPPTKGMHRGSPTHRQGRNQCSSLPAGR
jgi:hypothetical protein